VNADIQKRFGELEKIIQQIRISISVIEFLVLDTRKDGSFRTIGLGWITDCLVENLILNLYKVIHKDQKCSFIKIINIALNNKIQIDSHLLLKKIEVLSQYYESKSFQIVRDKYIAHLDHEAQQVRIDVIEIYKFTQEVEKFFSVLCKQFGRKVPRSSNRVLKSIKETVQAIYSIPIRYK